MSTTNTIDQLITMLQQRLPINLGAPQCAAELNKAWRTIEGKGAFIWNIKNSSFVLNPGQHGLTGLPNDADLGKPISIYPSPAAGFIYEIRFVPFDEFVRSSTFSFPGIAGIFSCWTITGGNSVPPTLSFAPIDAAPTLASGAMSYTVYYHHIVGPPLVAGTGAFFPTPDAYDDTLVDGAEAELRRYYGLAGFEAVQKKFETSTMLIIDKYRSPKRDLAGLSETMLENQENAASR